jgi:hypothetical protein
MKKIAYVLLLAGLGAAGCVPMSFFRDDKKPPQVEMKPKEPPAVTPDGITAQNAAERARSLREELEFDLRQKGPADEKEP